MGDATLPVEMHKEKWSDSSQRSFAYAGWTMTHYEDFSYRCKKCSQISIFTAEEQKEEYEVKQRFFGLSKTLCAACTLRLESLRKSTRDFERQWAENKSNLKHDYRFLCDWLAVLNDVPSFGKRPNTSMIGMLTNLAHDTVEHWTRDGRKDIRDLT